MSTDQRASHVSIFETLFEKSKALLSWTLKKVELSELNESRKKGDQGKPYVSMGDIYNAYLGSNIGSEIDKERPVLIFQGEDQYIRCSNVTLVIPISSNIDSKPYRVRFSISDINDNCGLRRGAVIIQQIRSISKARLTVYKGRLCNEKLKEVAQQVEKYLYKDIPLLLREGDAQTTVASAAKMHHDDA